MSLPAPERNWPDEKSDLQRLLPGPARGDLHELRRRGRLRRADAPLERLPAGLRREGPRPLGVTVSRQTLEPGALLERKRPAPWPSGDPDMTEQNSTTKRPYDAGKPTAARLVNAGEGLYAVDSHRGESKSYLVNVKAGTCTCPHW